VCDNLSPAHSEKLTRTPRACTGSLTAMFEYNTDEGRLEALHHPFTAPQGEVTATTDLSGALAHAYDLVYNGVEIGGGSLRIYRRDIQERVFAAIGLSDEEARGKFGYLLDAFGGGAAHGASCLGSIALRCCCRNASIRCGPESPTCTSSSAWPSLAVQCHRNRCVNGHQLDKIRTATRQHFVDCVIADKAAPIEGSWCACFINNLSCLAIVLALWLC
jgi:hypothetical protein